MKLNIIFFSINYKYVALIGDLNGQTADKDDFFSIYNSTYVHFCK